MFVKGADGTDQLCGQIPDGTKGQRIWYDVDCVDPLPYGEGVKLVDTKGTTYLAIESIEVFGTVGMEAPATDSDGPVEFDATSVKNKVYDDSKWPAKHAIDGNKDTCTQSKYGDNSWWEAALTKKTNVTKVRILNCKKNAWFLGSLKVMVDGKFCASIPEKPDGKDTQPSTWYDFVCDKPIYGSNIRLETNRRIDMAEIEVYG